MHRQGNRKAGKGLRAAGKLGGILCALWLVGCGEAAVFPQAEDETLYEPERESVAAQENPYESSGYELMDEEGMGAYLKSLGMEDVSPICYYDPEGAPKLELYYNRETGQGCGLEYEETGDGAYPQGFEISGYESYLRKNYWNFHNPYSTQIAYGEAWRIDRIPCFLYQKTTGLEETYTYDSENRLCVYHLRGCVETEEGEREQEELFTVSFSYRENGTLQEKEYWFSEEVFGHESVDWNPH